MKQFILFMGMVVSLCSCIQDDGEEKAMFGKEVTFSLASSVSRAGDTQFSAGDEIGVFAVEREPCIGVLNDVGNYADNKRFRFNGTTFVPATEEDKISFSATSTLDFYVYYPFMEHPENVTAHRFKVASDQRDRFSKNDLMLAKDVSGVRNPVIPLTFHHQMALTEVSLRVGEGKKVGHMQILNRAVGGIVNFQDQNYETVGSEVSDIEMLKVDESEDVVTFRALLPKQVIRGGNPLFRFQVDGKEHTYQAGQDVSLIQGAKSVYDVAFQCQVNLSADSQGRVSGGGIYDCGKSATVVAVPNTGYSFAGWYENEVRVSGEAIYTFVVKREVSLTARFTANAHLISVTAGQGGTVEGGGFVGTGASCTVTATEKNGYAFEGWYENQSKVSDQMIYTFSMTSSRVLEARFTMEKIYVEPRLLYSLSNGAQRYGRGAVFLYYLRNGQRVIYLPEHPVKVVLSFGWDGINIDADRNEYGLIAEDVELDTPVGKPPYYWGLIGVDEHLVINRYRMVKYTRLYNMYFDRSNDPTKREYIFNGYTIGIYLDKRVAGTEDQLLSELRNEYDNWIGDQYPPSQ